MKNNLVNCFYIEKKPRLDGHHFIHVKACDLLPRKNARTKLGFFSKFEDAIEAAGKEHNRIKLCSECCNF